MKKLHDSNHFIDKDDIYSEADYYKKKQKTRSVDDDTNTIKYNSLNLEMQKIRL